MARITVLMYPEPGHLLPTFRISSRLRARGHVVSYLVTPAFMPVVADLGFEGRSIFDGIVPEVGHRPSLYESPVPGIMLWARLARHLGVRSGTTRTTIRQAAAEHFVPVVNQTRPDLVLCDSKVVEACGDIVSQAGKIRMIALCTELPANGHALDCPELVLCPEELEIPGSYVNVPRRSYCEPSILQRRPPVRKSPPVGVSKYLVFCSLGTQSASYPNALSILQSVVDAFSRRTDVRVIVAAGGLTSNLALRKIPANVTVVGAVDQLRVLARANLAILHGGLGGVKESIVCGVPMIIVPFAFDQLPNSERIRHHGLGEIMPPANCDANSILAVADRLLSDQAIQRNITRMRCAFEDAEIREPAVRIISKAID
jgi:UDP:flavonoid glycosyltransferase YjiC (YdhE family)